MQARRLWPLASRSLASTATTLAGTTRDIEVTVLSRLLLSKTGGTSERGNRIWTVDEAVEHYGQLAEVGLDHVIWTLPNVADDTAYTLVSDVVRQLEPVRSGLR